MIQISVLQVTIELALIHYIKYLRVLHPSLGCQAPTFSVLRSSFGKFLLSGASCSTRLQTPWDQTSLNSLPCLFSLNNSICNFFYVIFLSLVLLPLSIYGVFMILLQFHLSACLALSSCNHVLGFTKIYSKSPLPSFWLYKLYHCHPFLIVFDRLRTIACNFHCFYSHCPTFLFSVLKSLIYVM